MMETRTHFVKRYEPGDQARVELKNGRILDVINGRYYDAGTSAILQGGKIESMPGLAGEPTDIAPDYTIDLQGKTVLPTLYNTHCHLKSTGPTIVPSLGDMLGAKKYQEQQMVKNMVDCLAHGVTHIRDAWWSDLRDNRVIKEQISKGELRGPRILQSVAVGPTGSYLQEKLPTLVKIIGMPQVDPTKEYAGAVAFPMDATEKQVRDAVDIAIKERGAETIKIGDEPFSLISGKPAPMMTIEQLSALVDQARRHGVQSTMHHSTVESFRRGVKAGVSSLAHAPYDAPLTLEDVEAFKAAGCISDPTVSVFYSMLSWRLAGDHSNDHPELNRLTEFRDRTYTYAAIADEFHIPEYRAIVMNGYKRCTSGKPKMMGLMDVSQRLAWVSKNCHWIRELLSALRTRRSHDDRK